MVIIRIGPVSILEITPTKLYPRKLSNQLYSRVRETLWNHHPSGLPWKCDPSWIPSLWDFIETKI